MNTAHQESKTRARVERLRRRRAYLGNIRDDKRSPQEVERLANVNVRLRELTAA